MVESARLPDELRGGSELDADVEEQGLSALVDAEKLRLLFAKAVYPFVSSIVKAGLYVALVWTRLPHLRALAWWAAIIAVALSRLGLRARYRSRPRGVADTRHWNRIAFGGALLNGCLWGLTPFWLWLPGDLPSHMLFMLLSALLISGANAFTAPLRPSFLAFVLPLAAGVVTRMAVEPDWASRLMALVFLNFVVASVWTGLVGARGWIDHIRLHFRFALLTETLESRVAERTAELRAALRSRDDFLMVASHELRTPLTSLRLSAQFVEQLAASAEPTDLFRKEVARGMSTIVRQSQHLGRLIDELLEVSRAQAGGFAVAREEDVDLADAARAAAARLERELERAGSTLTIEAPAPVRGPWQADRLEQVVTNLLTNAIKFGCGKPIVVTVSGTPELAELRVSDRGLGVAAELQPRIFDRFQRGVSARHYGGLGLGLYIVRQVVEAYGGTVSVASVPTCGATFTVCLPRGPASAAH